ncbi:MAG: S8 family serine peptidase [Acidobacteria bacterium]|nr:S8 family serine peptidase [Acidobacteriota bacterium]
MRNKAKPANKVDKKVSPKLKWYLFYTFLVGLCLATLTLSNSQIVSNTSANANNKPTDEPQVLATTNGLPEAAQQQIAALIQEKNSRTPAQRKMDARLIRGVKEARGEAFAPGVESLRPVNLEKDKEGKVTVELKVTTTDDSFQKILMDAGADILFDSPQYKVIKAKAPLSSMEAIASLPQVVFIQPEIKAQLESVVDRNNTNNALASTFVGPNVANPQPNTTNQVSLATRIANVRNNLPAMISAAEKSSDKRKKPVITPNIGTVNSQGDTTHRAATARTMFSVNGTGIKIGVLSDTFNALGGATNDITTGNLPGPGNPNGFTTPVTVLQDLVSGTDEGRAMLQIVHDIAPGAQLFYATAFGGVANFAANIQALRTAGCDIIIDDVFYFNESPFQDGPIAQAVNTVTANGAIYFSSAGNAGSLKKGTSGVWEGDFADGGTLANLPGGSVNNFTPAGPTPTIANPVPAGGGSFYTLFWSDPLGQSSNDYDVFIFDSTLTILFDSGTNLQDGNDDPFEITAGGTFAGDRVVIFKSSAASPRALHLNTNRGRLSIATNGQTKGHNSAVNAFGCAATPAGPASAGVTGPFPNPFSPTNLVENFSSDGPRRMFYNANGTAITPGNLLFGTNGGTVRNKPDITAADGVSTTLAGGLNPFFGTSAAAPHAGALTALLKSANPMLTPAQIRSILTFSAIDIEGNGFDINSGFGILDAVNMLNAVQGQAVINFGGFTATESAPTNNNGAIDPGERARISVTLNNPSTTTATNVQATLALTNPITGVTVTTSTINFGNIAATSSVTNTANPFVVALTSNVTCGVNLAFTLTVNFGGGTSPVMFSFSVPTGRSVISTTTVTTILDATAPPASPDYIAATGTQTGRLLRNGVPSSCAVPKANPGLNDATVVRRFDSYRFTNTSAVTQCYTVNLMQPNTTLFTLSYNANGFIPATPSVNYLADPGASATNSTYSFNVPAGQQFTIAVHEVNANGGLNTTYTLTVSVNAIICDPAPAFTLENTSIYAADTNNNRLQRSDDDGMTWTSVGFGPGTTPGKFNAPRGVVASSDNMKIFVADTGNNRIQRSTDGGTTWAVIVGPGTAPNAVNQPGGLAYDEQNDKLYIADTNNNRVLVTNTASTATAVTAIFAGSAAGRNLGQFSQPRSVAIDLNGAVYVSDTGNNRIQMNTTGMTTGWTIFASATAGTAIGKMNQPRGIFVDSNGTVYVADTGNKRVQVNTGGVWSVFMPTGTAPGTVNGAEGVTVSITGNVFIGDTLNNRIQRKPAAGGTTTIVGGPGTGLGQFNSPTGMR